MSVADDLAIPVAAERDQRSFELLRIWIAEKNQHVSLRSGVWDDPAAWGIMLADLARHITNSYALNQGRDPEQVLQRIRAGFDVELDSPTDTPKPAM